MHAVGEFEQIGDYAENLSEQCEDIAESGVVFSDEALCEIGIMANAAEEIISLTIEAFESADNSITQKIEALEEVIDVLKETLKSKHIARLQNGQCTVKNGIPFLDIIHNLEKIADHCSNIGIYVLMYNDNANDFDTHEYRKVVSEANANLSDQWQKHYEQQYLDMIMLPERAAANKTAE